ncbi:MAG TPA: EcsC family protein [Sphingobacteriaceae bacterium]
MAVSPYEQLARQELQIWQQQMQHQPSLMNRLSKKMQDKLNSFIPEKVHGAITVAIQKMIEGVLFGAKFVAPRPLNEGTLAAREARIDTLIRRYRGTAVTEGAVTGAGGILLGLADFPLLLSIKMKMLYDIAAVYGYDVRDYRERLYFLHIFQLAFSSQKHRNHIYQKIEHWEEYHHSLPERVEEFDWRTFQQEYRDYIDLAKLAQLIPVIGAAVGAVANYRLINQLGATAKNAYRMRYFG